MLFMSFSLLARLVFYLPAGLRGFDWWVYFGIPGAASLWFPAALIIWGRKTLLPTCLSVLGGVFYFIVKAFTFAHWWHTLLCCILYLAVLVLYCLTVTGVLPSKKLLYPLFGLPLAFHLFVEDVFATFCPAQVCGSGCRNCPSWLSWLVCSARPWPWSENNAKQNSMVRHAVLFYR